MRSAARIGYMILAWLFVIGVLVQLFLVGLVVVAGQMGWGAHGDLGHVLGFHLVLMLVSMYLGRLPTDLKRVTWILFGVYIFQADIAIFLRGTLPAVSALHPVLALIDFSLGLSLARRSTANLRDEKGQRDSPSAVANALPADR